MTELRNRSDNPEKLAQLFSVCSILTGSEEPVLPPADVRYALVID